MLYSITINSDVACTHQREYIRDYFSRRSRVFQILKESMVQRNQQLSELKNLFSYLEQHRSLRGYDGPKTSR